jgi:hypothetical protein
MPAVAAPQDGVDRLGLPLGIGPVRQEREFGRRRRDWRDIALPPLKMLVDGRAGVDSNVGTGRGSAAEAHHPPEVEAGAASREAAGDRRLNSSNAASTAGRRTDQTITAPCQPVNPTCASSSSVRKRSRQLPSNQTLAT